MDTATYSQEALRKFVVDVVCQGDSLLLQYYDADDVKKFRTRLKRVGDQSKIDKVVSTVMTDIFRAKVYAMVRKLSERMKPFGSVIVSGGEAFNRYLPKNQRVITSDIDTKMVPSINTIGDKKAFGKIQIVKLALWETIGELATAANATSMEKTKRILSSHKISRFLMIRLGSDLPFKIRYTLKPKKKLGTLNVPSKGDVLLDVNIFAIDLSMRRFDVRYGNSRLYNMGGILDVPVLPRFEFSSDVERDYTIMSGVAVASKRFLVEDLALMVRYGIREGEKLNKDKTRLRRFIHHVLGLVIEPNASVEEMVAAATRKVGVSTNRNVRNACFPLDEWKHLFPTKYAHLSAPIRRKQLVYFLSPILSIQDFGNPKNVENFNARKGKWVVRRKKSSKVTFKFIEGVKSSELKAVMLTLRTVLQSEKGLGRGMLYGYDSVRDKWMPNGLVDRAAMLQFVAPLK